MNFRKLSEILNALNNQKRLDFSAYQGISPYSLMSETGIYLKKFNLKKFDQTEARQVVLVFELLRDIVFNNNIVVCENHLQINNFYIRKNKIRNFNFNLEALINKSTSSYSQYLIKSKIKHSVVNKAILLYWCLIQLSP